MSSMIVFVMNSILLGAGLAMDAFSVSMANGLNEPGMKPGRMHLIAGTFAGYQFLMPMIGWLCIHTIAGTFTSFQKFIPWIALILLGYIGGKMLWEGLHDRNENEVSTGTALTYKALMVQGIATSIDALSVGFTIADYTVWKALLACLLIAVTTWIICEAGLRIGQKAGTKLGGKASILGGVILIGIGLEIFLTSIF